jgi:hypothetical protein
MEVSKSHGRCMIYKHVRPSEMYDSHTKSALSTNDPHAARTIKNTHFSYGWWAARKWVAQATCLWQERHVSKHYKHTASSSGWLRPIDLRSPCVQKHARRDVRLALVATKGAFYVVSTLSWKNTPEFFVAYFACVTRRSIELTKYYCVAYCERAPGVLIVAVRSVFRLRAVRLVCDHQKRNFHVHASYYLAYFFCTETTRTCSTTHGGM